ncbi:MAG: sugar phosphate isomerase/epimerase family protein [bacterium]|nr:sugar phosphate isomerase/epimerase family protein [bacterium]
MIKHSIGIIQGRLSRPVGGRIQAFPARTWEAEFALAAELGLDAIEWIFEDPYQKNPLWTDEGRACVKEIVGKTGVRINQVCADYFMEHPFFRVSETERQQSIGILKQVMPFCREIGATSIEIPLLDNSRIETDEELASVLEIMNQALPLAEAHGLTLSFETSLEPEKFAKFMSALDSPAAKVVYDIGNSASLGYDTGEEIAAVGKYLSNVHLKDRVRGGSTAPLGTGNANFSKTFAAFKDLGYDGPITLQVARGEAGQEAETTRAHLKFFNKYL